MDSEGEPRGRHKEDVDMTTKPITCPKCGFIIQLEKENYTTLRVSKDFIDRIKETQIDTTYEATLRKLLGWTNTEEIEK